MGQTLYAIAALLAATTFSHTVLQRQVHLQRQGIAREVEEMAASVALETMEVIRSRAFDQEEVYCQKGDDECELDGSSSDVKEFTYSKNSDHFITGNRCHSTAISWAAHLQVWVDPDFVWPSQRIDCNDIDDYHKMEPAIVKLPMGDDDDVIEFQVEVEVEYVAPVSAKSKEFVRKNQKTPYKQVTVKVRDSWNGKPGVYVPEPVTLSRVMAYDYDPKH